MKTPPTREPVLLVNAVLGGLGTLYIATTSVVVTVVAAVVVLVITTRDPAAKGRDTR